MADLKISQMTAGSALGGTEVAPFVQTGANVKITAAQIKTWCSASPTLVTPALGVATATSIAIGGATIGSNALAVTGTTLFNNTVTISGAGLTAGGTIATSGGTGFNATNNAGGYLLRNGGTLITSPASASLQFGAADV